MADNRVVMETSLGTIKIELYADKAPVTVQNFLAYVDEGFYAGTLFHRVIPNFMIQGGGWEPGMRQKKTRAPIKNESGNGLVNARGTVAIARTAVPDSATVQFFINVVDNGFLDRARASDRVGYCVFGKVVEGLDVVDGIKAVRTTSRAGHADVPVTDVVIQSVRTWRPLSPAVLAWNAGTVRRIAEGIHADGAFDRLPILADALLDAGCDEEDVLEHLRSAKPHDPGCWVLNLILNKG
jgi:peptidyl-prolyl cis-trans isomerase B (cyclophilin B)